MEFLFYIPNERSQKQVCTNFHLHQTNFRNSCPPYWIRHLEFCNPFFTFLISDPKNQRIPILLKTDYFKIIVRHLQFQIFNSGFIISDLKNLRVRNFIQIRRLKINVRHIGSAILYFWIFILHSYNDRSQKQVCTNQTAFSNSCPPSWIRNLEFSNFYFAFLISYPKNWRAPISTQIRLF